MSPSLRASPSLACQAPEPQPRAPQNAFVTVSLSVIALSPLLSPYIPLSVFLLSTFYLHPDPIHYKHTAIFQYRRNGPILNERACAQSGDGAAGVSDSVFMLISI